MRIMITGVAPYLNLDDGGQAAILEVDSATVESDEGLPQAELDAIFVRIQSWHDGPDHPNWAPQNRHLKPEDHPILVALRNKRLRVTIETLDEQ